MALLLPFGYQFSDANGRPLAGGRLTLYENESTTLVSIYADPELTTPLENPVTLDAAGRPESNIYVDDETSYTLLLTTSAGSTVLTRDDVWGAHKGVGTSYNVGTGGKSRTLLAKIKELASVEDFDSVAEAISWAVANNEQVLVHEDLTVNIPSDAATLQIACDRLYPVKSGAKITLNIESGHKLTAGLLVRDGDYSMFYIQSEDWANDATPVTLAAGFTGINTTLLLPEDARDSTSANNLIVGLNCRMPVLDCQIDMENGAVHNATGGYVLAMNCDGWVTKGSGVINAGTNGLHCVASRVAAMATDWSGATQACMRITCGSHANLQGATGNNGEDGLFVSRASQAHFTNGVATGNSMRGIRCGRASSVSAENATLTGNAYGVNVIFGGRVSANAADVSNSSITGIHAIQNSTVEFSSGVADNCADGINARNGSFVNADAASCANCTGTGVIVFEGSTVVFTGGSAAGSALGTNVTGSDSRILVAESVVEGSGSIRMLAATALLNATSGAVTATMGDGPYRGFIRTVAMSGSNASTLTVANHETSSPEVFTFNASGDTLVLMWMGSKWITLASSGVTT